MQARWSRCISESASPCRRELQIAIVGNLAAILRSRLQSGNFDNADWSAHEKAPSPLAERAPLSFPLSLRGLAPRGLT